MGEFELWVGDRHTKTQTHTDIDAHINTIIWPGLGARLSKKRLQPMLAVEGVNVGDQN